MPRTDNVLVAGYTLEKKNLGESRKSMRPGKVQRQEFEYIRHGTQYVTRTDTLEAILEFREQIRQNK